MTSRTRTGRTAVAAGRAGAMLLAFATTACAQDRPSDTTDLSPVAAQHHAAAVNQDLATLRALTARYRDLDAAIQAGWNELVPGCRDNPPIGGMGWHYLNTDFVSLELNVLEPQILIYEPQRNGGHRFVGAEYIIPFLLLPASADPPVLMGQEFQRNFSDEVWMLHVWVGRNNPAGMFATWNPNVSCQHAE